MFYRIEAFSIYMKLYNKNCLDIKIKVGMANRFLSVIERKLINLIFYFIENYFIKKINYLKLFVIKIYKSLAKYLEAIT